MTHPDAYQTIEKPSLGDFRDRGSKFLGFLYPCVSEDEIKPIVDRLRKEHPAARHVCHASVIGMIHPTERSNDDGEPGGTAGLPILNQILSAELRNVALFVVRYFGGTKLGKPGLINAYKESARGAIAAADIKVRHAREVVRFQFEYDQTGAVMQSVERIPHAHIISHDYGQDCTLTVQIPVSEVDNAVHLFDHTDEVTVEAMDR
ncbi:MAG: YigZ family protein [Flavobacteriales bacterium]|nr:YigZ family protein [Flavobacteriales bacterium]